MSPTQSKLFDDARWSGIKAAFLYLAPPDAVCGLCEHPLYNGELIDADHILERSRGGKSDPENCRLVHRSCHRIRHGVPRWSNAS